MAYLCPVLNSPIWFDCNKDIFCTAHSCGRHGVKEFGAGPHIPLIDKAGGSNIVELITFISSISTVCVIRKNQLIDLRILRWKLGMLWYNLGHVKTPELDAVMASMSGRSSSRFVIDELLIEIDYTSAITCCEAAMQSIK